jgi:hypothetical protein
MSTNDIDKTYVSPYDKFLFEFDATHEKTKSQLKEIKKYLAIAEKRDNKEYSDKNSEIWESF